MHIVNVSSHVFAIIETGFSTTTSAYACIRTYCTYLCAFPNLLRQLAPVATDLCLTWQRLLEWIHPLGGVVPAWEQPVQSLGGLLPGGMHAATGADIV